MQRFYDWRLDGVVKDCASAKLAEATGF